MRSVVAWPAGLGAIVVVDAVLDRRQDGSTLSEATRLIYRTHTPFGRCAFIASWVAFAAWYPLHIIKPRFLYGIPVEPRTGVHGPKF